MTWGGRLEAFNVVPSGVTVAATNDTYTGTSVSLTASSYTPTQYVAHLVARLNAVAPPSTGAWSGSISTGSAGTGLVTLNCTGTWALTFTTAAAGTVIGFVGDIGSRSSAATGTQNCRGLWLPDCPLNLEGDPSMGPRDTDSRGTEGPTGTVVTLGGTAKYVHKNLRYSHVVQARIKESAATTTYASLEQWFNDTQFGAGHAWFSRGSTFQAYWYTGGADVLVGLDMNSGAAPTYGWNFSPAIDSFSNYVKRVDAGWLGMWAVDFPRIVSRG